MREIALGRRISDKALSFVRQRRGSIQRITTGWAVRAAKAGRAIVAEVAGEEGEEVFAFAGADIVVVLG